MEGGCVLMLVQFLVSCGAQNIKASDVASPFKPEVVVTRIEATVPTWKQVKNSCSQHRRMNVLFNSNHEKTALNAPQGRSTSPTTAVPA
jgi:hypothetical protein